MVLGLLTGAVTGVSKLLGGKKKKSGPKMASAIVKREPQEQQSKIKVKTKVVSVSNLMNTKSLESQDRKKSKKSSGVESIDGALDSIDNTLAGIIGTIKDTSTLQQQSIKRKNRRKAKIKKGEREEGLESKGGSVPKFGMKIPRLFKGAFDTIKNFFSNIIIGALLIFLLDNMVKVMDTLKNVYETMKNVITKVGNFLQPVWKAMKWIWPGNSPSGVSMVRDILNNPNTKDLMDRDKINEIANQYKKIEDQTKGIRALMADLSTDQEGNYSIPTLVPLLKSVGATDKEAVRLAAIGMHESSGNPNARNTTYPDNSYGLFQINMLDEPGYKLGEERRKKYGITNEDLLDPQTNAAVALDIMRTQGRSAWSTDSLVTPAQLEKGRESLNTNNLKMGNQSNINVNLLQKIASLMTTPSYANPGGTTIIAISDGDQASPTPSGGSSSPMILPIGPSRKDVVLNNYEFSVNNALWKIG